jgi:hypothetical protein
MEATLTLASFENQKISTWAASQNCGCPAPGAGGSRKDGVCMSATRQFPSLKKAPAWFAAGGAVLVALLALSVPQFSAQDPSGHAAHTGHEGMDM